MSPLDLVHPDTLLRPGPIGRAARLALGLLCLYALGAIVQGWPATTDHPVATLDERLLLFLAPLCAFNAVVNIGFGKSWGPRPLALSLVALVLAAGSTFALTGSVDGALLGLPLNLWLAYFYAHLGSSFVLAAILATPGCEMRSIPQWLGRLRDKPADGHRCPAAFLTRLDAWEHGRRASN